MSRRVKSSTTAAFSMLLHDNGLLLASLGLFGVFFLGMIFAGAATYNQQLHEHGSRSG